MIFDFTFGVRKLNGRPTLFMLCVVCVWLSDTLMLESCDVFMLWARAFRELLPFFNMPKTMKKGEVVIEALQVRLREVSLREEDAAELSCGR